MRTLVIPENVYDEIRRFAAKAKGGCETGVTLFGATIIWKVAQASYLKDCWPMLLGFRYVVLAVAGPGPRATHQPAHYSADTDYTSSVFQALRSALPSIEWLGELHLHPKGMTWLSGGDRETIRALLTSTATDTVRPSQFIAGVMQQTRHGVDIYPYYFNRVLNEGCRIPIEHVSSEADVVQEARQVACHRDERPLPVRQRLNGGSDANQGEGWLARVVNIGRRKKDVN